MATTSPKHRFVSLSLIALAVTSAAVSGCRYESRLPPGTCENEQISEMASPDKQWKAVLFDRQCGDEPSAMNASVLPATAALPDQPGNALRQDITGEGGHPFRMQWEWNGPLELLIRHDPTTKVAFSATEVGPVKVIVSVVDLKR